MTLVLVTILSFLVVLTSQNQSNFRITGGVPARPFQFPFQAYLKLFDVESAISGRVAGCGGSLISTTVVLTAAHCITRKKYAEVYLGVNDLKNLDRVVITSNKFLYHSLYNPKNLDFDIGLVKLPKDVMLTGKINVVELPSRSQIFDSFINRLAFVSGFGYNFTTGSLSKTLKYVAQRVVPNNQCKTSQNIELVTKRTICTTWLENYTQGTCYGDSGGPLVVVENKRYIQIGIVSFLDLRGCGFGFPSGYTRTTEMLNWIEKYANIKINP